MTAPAKPPETALQTFVEGTAVEYNLDKFPEAKFNRLIPTQSLSIPTDLLVPAYQIVTLDPAEGPDQKSPDHYKSNDVPAGHRALSARGLNKVATAASVTFFDEHRVDDGKDPDVIGVQVTAEMMLPTGARIRSPGTKWVNIRSQTMTDAQRAKFRSFFYEHVSTRARNRAIRALLSLRSSYPDRDIAKPFLVVSFVPNYNHPLIREAMVKNLVPAVAQVYGPPAAAQLEAGQPVTVDEAPEEDAAPASAGHEEPEWAKPTTTAETAKPAPVAPSKLANAIRSAAEASGLSGPISEAQRASIRPVLAEIDGAIESGFTRLFGADAMKSLTAAQAQAVMNAAGSFPDLESFAVAWRAMAAEA